MGPKTLVAGVLAFLMIAASTGFGEEDRTQKEKDPAPQRPQTDPRQLLRGDGEPGRKTEPGTVLRSLGVGMFLGAAGDLATTEWGLARPGLREANPLATSRGVRLSTHILAPAVAWWSTEELRKAGRPKLALALRIGVAVAYSYAALRNVHTIGTR